MDATLTTFDKAKLLAADFATRVAESDRNGSIDFSNFEKLSASGLLALTVPREQGGVGAGARETAGVLGVLAQGDPSTALVLAMHYIQHFALARGRRVAPRLARQLQREASEGVALINALRVEPDLGSPARGGLPATTARRDGESWRLHGHKIYSTGAPILKYFVVWARTDEPEPRVGSFVVPSDLDGIRIVETWDHLGLRASGSDDVHFDDVVIPLDNAIDLRRPQDWQAADAAMQGAAHSIFVAAIYDGIARAARDWLLRFLHERKPANLGASLATLPRVQEAVGEIEARLAVNSRLIQSVADDFDADRIVSTVEVNIAKLTATNNAVAVVEAALSLTGNHGLTRGNPLERHYRDVLCGRVHTPQDDAIRLSAGRAALGL